MKCLTSSLSSTPRRELQQPVASLSRSALRPGQPVGPHHQPITPAWDTEPGIDEDKARRNTGTLEIIRVAGADNPEGLLYYSPWDPNDARIRSLMERFQAKYKMPFNPLGIFFYEGGHMLFDAIKKAQTVTSDGLRQHLEGQKEFKGLLGRYVWGGEAEDGIRHPWMAALYAGE